MPERDDYTYEVVNHENPELKKPSSYVTFVFRYRSTGKLRLLQNAFYFTHILIYGSPEFLEAQGIVIEEPKIPALPGLSIPATPSASKPTTPSRIVSRRISNSLPPIPHPVSTMPEESEESATDCSDEESESSLRKRPKIETSLEALFPAPDTLFPERTVCLDLRVFLLLLLIYVIR